MEVEDEEVVQIEPEKPNFCAVETTTMEQEGEDGPMEERPVPVWQLFQVEPDQDITYGAGLKLEVQQLLDQQQPFEGQTRSEEIAGEVADRLMCLMGNLELFRTAGDGNCQFSALAVGYSGDPQHASCWRAMLVDSVQAELRLLNTLAGGRGLTEEETGLLGLYRKALPALLRPDGYAEGFTFALLARRLNIRIQWFDRRINAQDEQWRTTVAAGEAGTRETICLIQSQPLHMDCLLTKDETGKTVSLGHKCPWGGCKEQSACFVHPPGSREWTRTGGTENIRVELAKLVLSKGVWPTGGQLGKIIDIMSSGGQDRISAAITLHSLHPLREECARAGVALNSRSSLLCFLDERANVRAGAGGEGGGTEDQTVREMEPLQRSQWFAQRLGSVAEAGRGKSRMARGWTAQQSNYIMGQGWGVWDVVSETTAFSADNVLSSLCALLWKAGLIPADCRALGVGAVWCMPGQGARVIRVMARRHGTDISLHSTITAGGVTARVISQPLGFGNSTVVGALHRIGGGVGDRWRYAEAAQQAINAALERRGVVDRVRVGYRRFHGRIGEPGAEKGKGIPPRIFIVEATTLNVREAVRSALTLEEVTARHYSSAEIWGDPLSFVKNPMVAVQEARSQALTEEVEEARQGRVVELTINTTQIGGGWGGFEVWVRGILSQGGARVVRAEPVNNRDRSKTLVHLTLASEPMARTAVEVLRQHRMHGFHRTVAYERNLATAGPQVQEGRRAALATGARRGRGTTNSTQSAWAGAGGLNWTKETTSTEAKRQGGEPPQRQSSEGSRDSEELRTALKALQQSQADMAKRLDRQEAVTMDMRSSLEMVQAEAAETRMVNATNLSNAVKSLEGFMENLIKPLAHLAHPGHSGSGQG